MSAIDHPSAAAKAVGAIQARAAGFTPRVAVVLGSGLGTLAEEVARPQVIPYGEIPGFPQSGVAGHAGHLHLGHIGKTPVALMQGRAHFYEEGKADAMRVPIETFKALGAEILLLTNAAGSLNPASPPGSLMRLADHINLVQLSPLFGLTGNTRFVNLVGAYDAALGAQLEAAAAVIGEPLPAGTYVWFCGPHFETPAEIRAARLLGGDAVGMSTVPEVILGRYVGLRVAAVSMITNLGAGLSAEALSHEHTLKLAVVGAAKARRLLVRFLSDLT